MWALFVAMQAGVDPLARVVDPIRTHQNILHYHFALDLSEATRMLRGVATVHYRVEQPERQLVLDLDEAMTVDAIRANGRTVSFRRLADSVVVAHWGAPGDSLSVVVAYHGSPRDGLLQRRNARGRWSAFGDNWPNRAHFWLPLEDHPSDKASVLWDVVVPASWKVVANGRAVDTSEAVAGRRRWRYHEARRIPPYTFVVGAGELTVTPVSGPSRLEQSVWVYPEDSAFAVNGPFRRIDDMAAVYTDLIGPFPYDKLAHVQSSTRFGGMENAGAIFYAERGYLDRTMTEGLVAHETAHQWFGDAVTGYDWHHLWLSEGFATYFAALFWERIGEDSTFRAMMDASRARYLSSRVVDRPMLDLAVDDYTRLLNANSYQKGAWVLHMLRREIGDAAFFDGIRTYYSRYRDSTALSSDFRDRMEEASGTRLDWFFTQWLTQPGYPKLRVRVERIRESNRAVVEIRQVQPEAWGLFVLPVRVEIANVATGQKTTAAVVLRGPELRTTVLIPAGADTVRVDPAGDLLATVDIRWK